MPRAYTAPEESPSPELLLFRHRAAPCRAPEVWLQTQKRLLNKTWQLHDRVYRSAHLRGALLHRSRKHCAWGPLLASRRNKPRTALDQRVKHKNQSRTTKVVPPKTFTWWYRAIVVAAHTRTCTHTHARAHAYQRAIITARVYLHLREAE